MSAAGQRMQVIDVPQPGGPEALVLAERPVPLAGSPAVMAEVLRGFAGEGIDHVQLVLDPITTDSIRAVGAVLTEFDRA